MEVLRLVYQDQLTEAPRKRGLSERSGYGPDLGWTFVSSDCRSAQSCRTYHTLSIFSENNTYYTPNTFFCRRREESTLRWLNALVIDIDTKGSANAGLTLVDVLDRIHTAGLPKPTFIVRTPSGGFHVSFVFAQRRKAYSNVLQHYKKLQRTIAEEIGGDLQAVGAERWFRLPTSENLAYYTGERVSFDLLTDWYWINHEPGTTGGPRTSMAGTGSLLAHPAVQKLLEGAEKGVRDHTCYTLALAFKADGYPGEEAEACLHEWNARLREPLPGRTIRSKVKSAYKAGAPAGPAAEWIRGLSGLPFAYQRWEGAKSREERKTSHYHEWAGDIISTLQSRRRGEMTGAQRQLALWFGIPFSSLKEVLKLLQASGQAEVIISGKGRSAKTTLRLIRSPKVVPLHPRRRFLPVRLNGPDSYTYLVREVGGFVLWPPSASLLCPVYRPDG